MPEFFYNTRTRQVEEGRRSHWQSLMGPYPTREAAARALETARARSEAFDQADRRWKGADGSASDGSASDEGARDDAADGGAASQHEVR